MCVICISPKGIRQPNKEEFQAMFNANPHGAGYMFINDDALVEIHKGFMTFDDFWREIKGRKFTKRDVVIYHFRISTQGGVNPYMTHPFPLTANIENTKILDCACPVGIVHNGIIPCTTAPNDEYSDTARFVVEYLSTMITETDDISNPFFQREIAELIQSKMVLLDNQGFTTIGKFTTDDSGLMYSNMFWQRDLITQRFVKGDYRLFRNYTFECKTRR